MQVQLESTSKIVTLNGVQARIWEGHTASGIPCHAYVTRIAVAKDEDSTQFEKELLEQAAPSAAIAAIPLSMIL